MRTIVFLTLITVFISLSATDPVRSFEPCGDDLTCEDGLSCMKLPLFDAPVCTTPEEACDVVCKEADCAILESMPMQVACSDEGEPPTTDPDDETRPDNDGDTPEEGVFCENDAGECRISPDGGSCQCVNGEGAGWSDASGPESDNSDPGQATQDECVEKLTEICGESAPDLKEACGDALAPCVDGVAFVNETCFEPLTEDQINNLLDGRWIEEEDLAEQVYGCCHHHEDMKQITECLEQETCESCLRPEDDTDRDEDDGIDYEDGDREDNPDGNGDTADGEPNADTSDEHDGSSGDSTEETAAESGDDSQNLSDDSGGIKDSTSSGCSAVIL